MFIEILNDKISELTIDIKKLSPKIDKKKSEIKELQTELEKQKAENIKYALYSSKATYKESLLIAFVLFVVFGVLFFACNFSNGFNGLLPYDSDFVSDVLHMDSEGWVAFICVCIIILCLCCPQLALILWPIVSLIKRMILYKKSKKAKEITEQTQARIRIIESSISQTQSDLQKLTNEVQANNDNIKHIKKLLPIIDDYEKSLELRKNFSAENMNVNEIYHLLKSSVDRMSEECGYEFESVYKVMLEQFKTFKNSLISIEDGDALATISTMLMPEDYVFALQLLQKSVDRNSEAGKAAIKIVLDQSEQHIYNSEYNAAIEFLTPLKEAGNQEAKELWRKAMDLQHQEKIERERRIAEQKAREDEEMMRRVRERLNTTPERTFTQGGPTGCGIGGSFCGCGSGR